MQQRPLWIAMSRIKLLLCCWLLMPVHYAIGANTATQVNPTSQSASSTRVVKPLIIPAAKATAKPVIKPAVKSSKVATKPVSKAKPAKSAAKTVKPVQSKVKKPSSSAAPNNRAPSKLNLSLPPVQLKGVTFGKPLAEVEAAEQVLPPMFGEAKSEPSAYQLTGKLITNERQAESTDFFNSVDGAQLSIEFRQ